MAIGGRDARPPVIDISTNSTILALLFSAFKAHFQAVATRTGDGEDFDFAVDDTQAVIRLAARRIAGGHIKLALSERSRNSNG